MIWLRLSQILSGAVGCFNIVIGIVNVLLGSYWHGVINLTIGVVLAYLIVSQEYKFAKLRREIDGQAQRQLERCWLSGICPDCAAESLAFFGTEFAICSERECNSHFHRDQKTGQWTRIL